MSRTPVRTFLATAKAHLTRRRGVREENSPIAFVIGNESADLDSITSALVFGYLQSASQHKVGHNVIIPVTNIPTADLPLRPELTALLRHAGLNPTDLITLDDLPSETDLASHTTSWTLVDHNVFQGSLGQRFARAVTGVIDHHDDESAVPRDATPRIIEKSGSCSSLVVNYFRDAWSNLSSASTSVDAANAQDDAAYTSTWDAQVAKLALGSILIDTINLTEESKVTEHDLTAIKYLEAKIQASNAVGKDYTRDAFFKEINDAKSNIDDLSLVDILRKDYKEWEDNGLRLGVASVVQDIAYLQRKDEHFSAVCRTFMRDRKLDLFAIMTAYNPPQGEFARELLLISPQQGEAADAAARFTTDASTELKLQDSKLTVGDDDNDEHFTWQCWDQRNLAASRKRVAPLLREAMRGGGNSGGSGAGKL